MKKFVQSFDQFLNEKISIANIDAAISQEDDKKLKQKLIDIRGNVLHGKQLSKCQTKMAKEYGIIPESEILEKDLDTASAMSLLKAVKKDWGATSDLYYDLEDSIVGGDIESVKATLANYEVEDDYKLLIKKLK
jgi:hypothetical protein